MKKLLLLMLIPLMCNAGQFTYSTEQMQALFDKANTNVYTQAEVDAAINNAFVGVALNLAAYTNYVAATYYALGATNFVSSTNNSGYFLISGTQLVFRVQSGTNNIIDVNINN